MSPFAVQLLNGVVISLRFVVSDPLIFLTSIILCCSHLASFLPALVSRWLHSLFHCIYVVLIAIFAYHLSISLFSPQNSRLVRKFASRLFFILVSSSFVISSIRCDHFRLAVKAIHVAWLISVPLFAQIISFSIV